MLLGHWNNSSNKQWMLALSSGKLQINVSTDGSAVTTATEPGPALTADTWYHVALVRDSGGNEPVGIAAGYSRTFDANWLGGEQPTLSVLYRVKAS